MIEYFNISGCDTYQNPLETDGQLIAALNVINFPMGALSKRGGYRAVLNNPDGTAVNALFSFPKQNGTELYLYRAAGSLLYQSTQGTTNWAVAGNGTIANGNYVDSAILNNVMIVGDGSTPTRHTTNGTSFTNTTLAPVAQYLTQFHQRIYAADGTSSLLTYSSYGSADNWNIAIPADSSSFIVPDAGAITKPFVAGDRLVIPKNKARMFNWDDASLVDMSTNYGPTSPRSIAQIDDYWFYIHQVGLFGYDGANKQILSNAIQRQFYNRLGVNVSGVNLINSGGAIATTYYWDYIAAVGNINDDFTGKQYSNALIKYDYQKNTFVDWQFANFPTAMHSYQDYLNHPQFIFGDTTGQVYQYDPGFASDNGAPISTEMVFLFTYAAQANSFSQTSAQTIFGSSYEKKWNYWRGFFNPGCESNIQFAFSNTMQYQHLKWSEARNVRERGQSVDDWFQVSDGVVEMRFPNDTNNQPRSRFLFIRIYDDSDTSQFNYYGCQIDAEIQDLK